MRIEVQKVFSIKDAEANPHKLYVFGENQKQQGKSAIGGGQAVIRPLHNSYGFCTLYDIGRFWTDAHYSLNLVSIERDIFELKERAKHYDCIVFPYSGLGTGRANMQKSCPLTFLYMSTRLMKEFKYNNIANLISEPF